MPALMPALSEKDWQQTVIDTARAGGWWVHHHLDSRGSEEGWPDLVLLRPPACVFVELKTDRGQVRPAQAVVLEMLADSGLATAVWRPRDWPAVEARLLGRFSGRR